MTGPLPTTNTLAPPAPLSPPNAEEPQSEAQAEEAAQASKRDRGNVFIVYVDGTVSKHKNKFNTLKELKGCDQSTVKTVIKGKELQMGVVNNPRITLT